MLDPFDMAKSIPVLTRVDSSLLYSIGFRVVSSEKAYLFVKFHSKKVYRYEMSPSIAESHYQMMIGWGNSVGKYFNANIRSAYEFEEITVDAAENWQYVFSSESSIGRRCGLIRIIQEESFL